MVCLSTELSPFFEVISQAQQLLFSNCHRFILDSASKIANAMNELGNVQQPPPDEMPDGLNLIDGLPEVLLAKICTWINIKDLASLRTCNKTLSASLNPFDRTCTATKIIWHPIWAGFHADSHDDYLQKRLMHARDELGHWLALSELFQALKLLDRGFVVELAGNVGKFPNEAIAKAVTKRRPAALCGVIVTHANVGRIFRTKSAYKRSVSFMIAATSVSCAAPRPAIMAPGFIGYAIDLLELRPHEECLKESVLASYVYRDLTVWESHQDIVNAIENRTYTTITPPFFCALTDVDLRPRALIGLDPDQVHEENDAQFRNVTAPHTMYRPRIRQVDSSRDVVQSLRATIASLELAMQQ